MGAFYAAMNIQPRLHPTEEETSDYKGSPGGVQIKVKYVNALV
jgi:hypothetical protein